MAEVVSPEIVGGAIGAITIAINTVLSHFKGRNRTKETNDSLHRHFRQLGDSIDRRFDTVEERIDGIERGLDRVTSFCIGPDGENGFRGDIRKINARLEEADRRERDRLERGIGAFDRRTGS